jgi:hypothetical protein
MGDFGTPATTTDYRLCIYDASNLKMTAQAPAGGTCGTQPCWKPLGDVGFKYRDKSGGPGGLAKLLLRAGGPNQARIQANPPRGAVSSLPPLPLTTPVRVQLQQSGSSTCWEATYSNPAKDDSAQFKARSD